LEPARRAVLPSDLSVLVETRDGAPLSLLLGLRRNSRDQLDVRVAEGAQVYDGRRVWRITPAPKGLVVDDEVSGERVALPAGAGARILAVHQRSVWVETPDGPLACGMKDGRCARAAPPDLPLDHPGPGSGFRLVLDAGTLRVALPQERDEGVVLATGVTRVLGAYWVRGGSGEADAVVHRTFRGRARVHAVARAVTADGALTDWETSAPLVVEAPWQLQSGGADWRGARDGSFSVAAAWTADQVCLAGRVRDDEVSAADELVVQVGPVARRVTLGSDATGDVYVRHGWLGVSWEMCIPSGALPARDRLPLAVTFTDVDTDEGPTVLASAPLEAGSPLGELLLDAPGP